MKKNLLNKTTANYITYRVNNLEINSKPLWGEMNATEMLIHCNICNQQILDEERLDSRTSIKQFLLRILALYLAPNFTKNLKSEPRNDAKGKIDSAYFDKEKEEFIEIINQFPNVTKKLSLTHPAFGNISTKEWGIAAYKHMDNHLRQFGF
jgi:hypothetical protein